MLCSSLATLERCVAAGFDRARLRHVPLGVDAAQRTSRPWRAREAYGLPGPYVLWTGTVEPRKNLQGLVQAYALLDADVDLVLVGPKGWQENLDPTGGEACRPSGAARSAASAGCRATTSTRSTRAPAVFCFPSLLEGFGFPVVEAMAQGTPVVTSLGTSTEELVADGAGLAVDPHSEAIAEALDACSREPALAASLAAAGRVRAGEYTWERTGRARRGRVPGGG